MQKLTDYQKPLLFTVVALGWMPAPAKSDELTEAWRVVRLAQNRMHPLRPSGWVGNENWWFISPLENGIATASRWVYKTSTAADSSPFHTMEGRIVDATGMILDQPIFDDIEAFLEGLAAFKQDGQWGFIDHDLKQVIKPAFDAVQGFLHGWCAARKDGKWGFIDRKGKWLLQPAWDELRAFPHPEPNSLARARQDKLWGFINRQGKWVIPAQYNHVQAFHATSTFVQEVSKTDKAGLLKLIDVSGKTLSPERWIFTFGFSIDGPALAAVETQAGTWGHLKPDGSYLHPPQWEKTMPFRDGHAVVWKNKKAGLINESGDLVIEHQWDQLRDLAEGFIVAERGDLQGYIEIATGRIIEPQWTRAEPFHNGLGLALHAYQWHLIKADGTPAAAPLPRWPPLPDLTETPQPDPPSKSQ
jgi:hypothetical protein